jgi:hypothetical protein
MSRRERDVDVEVQSLLENARAVRPVRDAVRERALTRASAAAKAAGLPAEAQNSLRPRWSLRGIALAAAVVVGVASAAFAFGARWSQGPARAVSVPARAIAPSPSQARRVPERISEIALPESRRVVSPERDAALSSADPGRVVQSQAFAAETELLRRAHAAYASRDFLSALLLVAEHSRRFLSGVLSEEREALRVRSLAGAGRNSEARSAVEMFAKRFPRSVLLPRLHGIGAAE